VSAVPERPEKRLLIAVLLMMATIVIGSVMYKILTDNRYDWLTCFYMTVITVSTVGFGEVVDTGAFPAARIFTCALVLFGWGILAYGLSTVTAIMVEMDLRDVFKRRKMNRDISQMQNHVIVCGSGATGTCIVEELMKTGTRFVVIERDPERVEALQRHGDIVHIQGDATDDEILIRAGIDRASALAAALSTEKDNLFLALTARQLNPSLRIVARGLDHSVNQKLRKAGANAVVSPTFIGGLRMASELIRPSVVSFLDTMLRDASGTIRFEEIRITRGSPFLGQTIKSTNLREKSNLLIVALRRSDGEPFIYNPPADTVLSEGTTLVVLGESRQINELKEASAIGA
jgi:voltage-gated potassium channel